MSLPMDIIRRLIGKITITDPARVSHLSSHWNEGGLGGSKMLRVSGAVEFVKDAALEKRLYEERPWLLDALFFEL